jgi:hypothetical protein
MIDNLINNSLNNTIDFINNLSQNIKDNKTKILLIFLLVIKKIYGNTTIFDILCILYTVIVFLYMSDDIDKGNNFLENSSIKKHGLMGLMIYFISNSTMISHNTNLGSNISNLMKMLMNIIIANK